MEKYNAYVRHNVATIRQLQVIYLSSECGLSVAEIAEITEYAVSTVRNYLREFAGCESLASQYFYVEEIATEVEPTAVVYRKFRDGRCVPMEFMPGCGENVKGEQAVYFFKFYNANGLEFNKVGTSAKDVVGRLRDEIGDYSKKFPIHRVEIHRIRSCGEIPAEGIESALRSVLIKKYPTAYKRNDRFFGVDIDPTIFDEVFNQFFE